MNNPRLELIVTCGVVGLYGGTFIMSAEYT